MKLEAACLFDTHAHSYVGVNKMQHRILVFENLNPKKINISLSLIKRHDMQAGGVDET